MSARRPALIRRLLAGAVDVVNDRAPWLSEQAYRVVAAPLQWSDPVGAARIAESRLDDVRERVVAMARRGRTDRTGGRRIRRDLARTRQDVERIAPRLPAVLARSLAARVAAYSDALSALPGGTASAARPRSVREAVAVAGAAAGTSAALFLPLGSTLLEGGLLAGSAAAVGLTAAQRRRARREHLAEVVRALSDADRLTLGPDGADLRDLDAGRRGLVRRALASGRLDPDGTAALRRIDTLLEDLLVRLLDGDLEPDASYLVQATVTRYLPDTLEPFLALTDPRTLVRGRPVAVEVAEQLAAVERGLAEVAQRSGRVRPENLLYLQGEFLRDRFGGASHPDGRAQGEQGVVRPGSNGRRGSDGRDRANG